MSAVPIIMVALGCVMKLMKAQQVIEGMGRAGYAESLIVPVGMIELVCVIIYAIPRTSVLGAILFTGLLGGATATSVRVGDPSFIFPLILGGMVWGGLFLRDPRLRDLLPLRKERGPLESSNTNTLETRRGAFA